MEIYLVCNFNGVTVKAFRDEDKALEHIEELAIEKAKNEILHLNSLLG